MEIKSRVTEFELNSGKTVDLTLNFKKLMEVRNKRKELYKRYNEILMNGAKDSFDSVTVLYTAYVCGLEDTDSAMSEEAFIEEMPPYPQFVYQTAVSLMFPKKKTDSEKHSEMRPENQNEE